MSVKLIVGLGNPGKQFFYTRHNVGSWYVYRLSKWIDSPLQKEKKFTGYTSHGNFFGTDVRLLVPNTFMNLSGDAVIEMASFYGIGSNEILVAHDELDILPGIAKFKFGGGHGGHNGLKNIIEQLKKNRNGESSFYRLRIGVGHPGDKNKVINFLLCNPSTFEKKIIEMAVNEAVNCTKIWFQFGFMKAVTRLHSFKAMR